MQHFFFTYTRKKMSFHNSNQCGWPRTPLEPPPTVIRGRTISVTRHGPGRQGNAPEQTGRTGGSHGSGVTRLSSSRALQCQRGDEFIHWPPSQATCWMTTQTPLSPRRRDEAERAVTHDRRAAPLSPPPATRKKPRLRGSQGATAGPSEPQKRQARARRLCVQCGHREEQQR